MIKKIQITGLLMVFLFFGGTPVYAAGYEQEFLVRSEPILSGGANRLDLRFNIRHGKVTFKLSDDPDFIVRVLVNYDNKELAGGGWSKEKENSPEGYMTDDYEDQESKLNLHVLSTATSVHIKREGTNPQYRLSY